MNDNDIVSSSDSGAMLLESVLNENARAGYSLKLAIGPYAIMEADRPDAIGTGVRYKVVPAPSVHQAAGQRSDQIISEFLNEEGEAPDGSVRPWRTSAAETSAQVPAKFGKRVAAQVNPTPPPPTRARAKAAGEEDSKPRVAVLEHIGQIKPAYWITLSFCLLFLSVYGMWLLASRPTGPAALAARALSGASAEERTQAAAELASRKSEAGALLQLRRVAQESNDPVVLRSVFAGLTMALDTGSTDLFLAGLSNGDPSVRDAAYKGLVRVMAIPTEKQDEFKADAPEETRSEAIVRLKKQFTPDPGMLP